MLTLGVIVAGLFSVIWISTLRHHARHCAESAALAAGHAFLSDDLLRMDQQPFQTEGRIALARNAAVAVAADFARTSSLPAISPDDVRMLWNSDESVTVESGPVPDRIAVSFGNPGKQSIALFFPGLTGRASENLGVQCQVALERCPAAFQPGQHSPVPILPFAVFDDPAQSSRNNGTRAAGYWTEQIESGPGRDAWSWNPSARLFDQGPDGLPEITCVLTAAGSVLSPDAFVPLSFTHESSDTNSASITSWIHDGLTTQHLNSLGLKQLEFPGRLPLLALSADQLRQIASALMDRTGEPLVIALCSAIPVDSTETSGASGRRVMISLKRPVAARIVRVDTAVSGSLKITLQPCVLRTSTAITSAEKSAMRNRYIYSVRLCQ